MEDTPTIQTLSIGLPRTLQTTKGKEFISAIAKQSSSGAFLSVDGFIGDGIADTKHHGGPDRAVCIYSQEHYSLWEKEFDCLLPSATFGENLTVEGMLEQDVCIGDVFRVGEALIQVTQGRVPCSTINQRTGLPRLMKRMIETGFTGFLCRVLEEGHVHSDSSISLESRDPHRVTILYANEVYFQRPRDIEGHEQIIAVDALADVWRQDIKKRLERLQTT